MDRLSEIKKHIEDYRHNPNYIHGYVEGLYHFGVITLEEYHKLLNIMV